MGHTPKSQSHSTHSLSRCHAGSPLAGFRHASRQYLTLQASLAAFIAAASCGCLWLCHGMPYALTVRAYPYYRENRGPPPWQPVQPADCWANRLSSSNPSPHAGGYGMSGMSDSQKSKMTKYRTLGVKYDLPFIS